MCGPDLTRRDSLLTIGAGAAGLVAWDGSWQPARASDAGASHNRVLRVAHLSDIHVQPELRAADGMTSALHHAQQLADKPALIITGGDSIMDSFDADEARTKLQWDLWSRVLKDECSLPIRSCIGNHDVWGWAKSKSHTTGREPLWGKKRAVEMLHLEGRYYSFAQAGWQFLVLDSTQPLPNGCEGYTANLDEGQFDWLVRTLRDLSTEVPVMIVSHIPLMSATPFLYADYKEGDFEVSGSWVHTDFLKLKDLFAGHPNVKLCISGHMHLLDRVDYNGVTYLCNGAVSGSWWKGRNVDCDEGYAVVDLYDDGTFDHQYVKYGWQAEVEKPQVAPAAECEPA